MNRTLWILLFALGCADVPSGDGDLRVDPPGSAPAAEPRAPTVRSASPPSAVGAAVSDLEVQDWLTTPTTADAGEVTLIVFWEVWCPHCRKEVPRLEEVHQRFGGDGLNVVALTRLTRDTPRDTAADFLETSHVTYAAGVGGEALAKRLGVRGVPSAVAVRDGVVVWQGHPSIVDDAQIERWLHPG